jgi:fructose-1,6-bisphosphatase I
MSKLITLHEFIVTKQKDFPFASGELSRLLHDISLAAKIVSNDVRKAGLVDHILGAQGGQNVQGEDQQKLDVVADEAFIRAFQNGGQPILASALLGAWQVVPSFDAQQIAAGCARVGQAVV